VQPDRKGAPGKILGLPSPLFVAVHAQFLASLVLVDFGLAAFLE
jgi:hypothetical protein